MDAVAIIIFGESLCGLGRFDDARRRTGAATTAVEATKETWSEARGPSHCRGNPACRRRRSRTQLKPQAYFQRALTVARQQQAKSWELARSDERGAALRRDRGVSRGKLANCCSGLWAG